MMIHLKYFDTPHALIEQRRIIDLSGGLHGVREQGLLDSILTHIRNDDYYPTFEEKVTHLLYAVNKSHVFIDGNKRISIALAAYFLEINGLGHRVVYFIRALENIAVWVADNKIDKELLGDIVMSLLIEDDYQEDLKWRLIRALHKT
jgi:death on curing protein